MYRTDINCRTAVKIGLATVPSKLPYGMPYGSSSVLTDQHSASTQTLVPSAGRNRRFPVSTAPDRSCAHLAGCGGTL